MRLLPFVLGSCVAISGCSGDAAVGPPLELPAANEPMPERLSELGLYPSAPNLDVVGGGAIAYTPRFPLWSDGGEKQRFIAHPDGLEAAPAPYPEDSALGTVFFKTFSFETERDSGLLPVETRVMRLGDEGWEYYRYLWEEDGQDAVLLTSRESQLVRVFADGEEFEHEVPGEVDCKTCHEASDSPVLGYRELQLEDTPLDPDPVTEQVMGYALGNCTHCHNGSDSEAGILDLRPDVFLENTVDRPAQGTSAGYGLRVAPGRPDESILFLALSREAESAAPMPPLGIGRRDEASLELFREWIEGL